MESGGNPQWSRLREWRPARSPGARRHAAALCSAKRSSTYRAAVRLRAGAVRSLFRPDRRQGNALLHYCRFPMRLPARKSPRSKAFPRRWAKQKGLSEEEAEEHASSGSASLDRGANSSVRILPERHDDQGDRAAGKHSESDRRRNQGGVHHFGPSPHLCRCGTYTAIIEAVQRPPRSWRRGGKQWRPGTANPRMYLERH